MRAWTVLGRTLPTLVYGNCRDLPMFYMFYTYEKSISRKNMALPIEKLNFRLLYRIRMRYFTTPYYPISALLPSEWSLTGG